MQQLPAQSGDHCAQSIRAHMGSGLIEDLPGRTEGGKGLQNRCLAGVVGAGVEFSIREGPSAALPKLDIGLRQQNAVVPEGGNVLRPLFDGRPRSMTKGLAPARARSSAQKSPAGPIPTTIGRVLQCTGPSGKRQTGRSSG